MFGSFLPSAWSSTKAYSGRGSRPCYAIKFPASKFNLDDYVVYQELSQRYSWGDFYFTVPSDSLFVNARAPPQITRPSPKAGIKMAFANIAPAASTSLDGWNWGGVGDGYTKLLIDAASMNTPMKIRAHPTDCHGLLLAG